jgi:hypothetical protein
MKTTTTTITTGKKLCCCMRLFVHAGYIHANPPNNK